MAVAHAATADDCQGDAIHLGCLLLGVGVCKESLIV